ncbi:beta-lactamase-like protein [Daldinia caldariorum]|uniref:beta-lactamase-like protein n=1 Tax=Daldinia caldariorum TaxID=326644 RepID=UPI0020078AB4|nr:beta-lactamase-like protein [Daldinia caldariorum]KAI1463187.1 beta-lactamase-like protein [Daldinia caldariorum]
MTSSEPAYDPKKTGPWLICTACGTQFPTADRQKVKTCFICDDPRQFTPPTGQAFTSLDELRSNTKNVWTPFEGDDRFISIHTEPKVAIGQRAILIKTPNGNALWDCLTLIDDDTINRIKSLGGLKAIVISHPHYYSTHVEWARAFGCPVYLAAEDKQWVTQTSAHQVFVKETELDLKIKGISSGVKVLKLGGHFPGSFVALYEKHLLIADTLVTTPSGLGSWNTDASGAFRTRPAGLNSYSFMWSIPNMIPLAPDELQRMWSILKKYDFSSTHGAFLEMDIVKTIPEMKRRVLESMQIQIKYMGYGDHALLKETIA